MEPVHGDGGVGEGFADGGNEGAAHVADHLDNVARLAAMPDQERLELGDSLLAPARSDEHHRLVLAVEVDENGDVGVAALGGGLVEADGGDLGQVETRHRLADIVLDDTPQPLVGDLDNACHRQDRHLADQRQRRLLEQQCERAAFPRPRHADPKHPVIGAVCARHLGGDVAVVLEEVEMPPSELGEVVGLAGPAAHRAGEQAAPVGSHLQMQDVRLHCGVEPLANQFPRRRHPQAQGQNRVGVHVSPFARPRPPQIATVLAPVKDAFGAADAVACSHP